MMKIKLLSAFPTYICLASDHYCCRCYFIQQKSKFSFSSQLFSVVCQSSLEHSAGKSNAHAVAFEDWFCHSGAKFHITILRNEIGEQAQQNTSRNCDNSSWPAGTTSKFGRGEPKGKYSVLFPYLFVLIYMFTCNSTIAHKGKFFSNKKTNGGLLSLWALHKVLNQNEHVVKVSVQGAGFLSDIWSTRGRS